MSGNSYFSLNYLNTQSSKSSRSSTSSPNSERTLRISSSWTQPVVPTGVLKDMLSCHARSFGALPLSTNGKGMDTMLEDILFCQVGSSDLIDLVHMEEKENEIRQRSPALNSVLPELLARIKRGTRDDGVFRKLYELTNNRNRHNRIPMVSRSFKWDVLTPLINQLHQSNSPELHIVCLTLNNLSIPYSNKAIMTSQEGDIFQSLLTGFCKIIKEDRPESCIVFICLVNLSLLRPAIGPMFYFTLIDLPHLPLSKNPHALIKLIEIFMSIQPTPSPDVTIRNESLRYACGFITNCCICEEHTNLLSTTNIPAIVLGFLKNSLVNPSLWTVESLEDYAMRVMNRLAWWVESRRSLLRADAILIMGEIADKGDSIYSMRAGKIRDFLTAKESDDMEFETRS